MALSRSSSGRGPLESELEEGDEFQQSLSVSAKSATHSAVVAGESHRSARLRILTMAASSSSAPSGCVQAPGTSSMASSWAGSKRLASHEDNKFPAKKNRCVSKEELGDEMMMDIVSVQDQGQGSDIVCESDTEGGDQEVQAGKSCLGCLRLGGPDLSFSVLGSSFSWRYAKGRGAWCQDCHNVYRVFFKALMTLVIFERWVQGSDNRRAFLKALIAYLSLKFEGCKHVAKAMVERRIQLLDYVFGLVGVPWPVPAVCLDPEKMPVELPRYLIPIFSGQGSSSSSSSSSVAALCPAILHMDEGQTLSRIVSSTVVSEGWPVHPIRSEDPECGQKWGASSSGSSAAATALAFKNQAEAEAEAEAEASGEPSLKKTIPPAEAGFRARLAGHEEGLKMLLVDLLGNPCGQAANKKPRSPIKEKDFTPLVSKLLRLAHELQETPFGHLMKDIEVITNTTTAAKKCVRPLRDYEKTQNRKHLHILYPFLKTLLPWMAERHQVFNFPMRIMYAKGEFMQATSAEESLKAFNGSSDWACKVKGGEKEKEARDSQVVAAIVECVASHIASGLNEPLPEAADFCQSQAEAWDAKKDVFLATASLVVEFVNDKSKLHDGFDEFVSVLSAYSAVVLAAFGSKAGGLLARLKSAFDTLASADSATLIHKGFENGACGGSLKADASIMLAFGKFDEQCDEEYKKVVQNLFTAGMPSFDDQSTLVVEVESCSIKDGKCFVLSIMTEAIDLLGSIFSKWSMSRQGSELESLASLLLQMRCCVDGFNALRNYETMQMLQGFWVAIDTHLCESEEDGRWPPVALSPSKCSLPETPDEDCMSIFVTEMQKFVVGALTKHSDDEELKKTIADLAGAVTTWSDESALRSRIWLEAKAMEDLIETLGWPEKLCMDDYYNEYVTNRSGVLQNVMRLTVLRAKKMDQYKTDISDNITFYFKSDTEDIDKTGNEGKDDAQHEGGFVSYDVGACKSFYDQCAAGLGIMAVMTKLSAPAFGLAAKGFVDSIRILSHGPLISASREVWQAGCTDTDIDEFVSNLFGKECFDKMVANMVAAFPDPKCQQFNENILNELPHLKAGNALYRLADVCLDKNSIRVEGLVREGHSWPAATLDCSISLYSQVCEVLYLIAFLAAMVGQVGKAFAPGFSIVVETVKEETTIKQVNPAWVSAWRSLRDSSGSLWAPLQAEVDSAVGSQHAALSLRDLSVMMQGISEVVVPKLAQVLVKLVRDEIKLDTKKVEENTPRWNHLVSNTKYQGQLAKKQLLGHPSREALPPLINKLHGLIESFAAVCTELGIEEKPCDMEGLAEAEPVLEHATLSMTVIAAVNVVEQLSSTADGRAMAKTVWENGGKSLPQALRIKLEALTADA
jgi:hypothetical protein